MKNRQFKIEYIYEDGTKVNFNCIISLINWKYIDDKLNKIYRIDFPTLEDKIELYESYFPSENIPDLNNIVICPKCGESYKAKECSIFSLTVSEINDYFQIEHPFQLKGDDGGIVICCKNENCLGDATDWITKI